MGFEGRYGHGLPVGRTVSVLGENWVVDAAGVVSGTRKWPRLGQVAHLVKASSQYAKVMGSILRQAHTRISQ